MSTSDSLLISTQSTSTSIADTSATHKPVQVEMRSLRVCRTPLSPIHSLGLNSGTNSRGLCDRHNPDDHTRTQVGKGCHGAAVSASRRSQGHPDRKCSKTCRRFLESTSAGSSSLTGHLETVQTGQRGTSDFPRRESIATNF